MILPSLPRVAIARHCALLVLLALAAASAHAASTRLEQQRRQFPAAYAAAKAGPGEHWRDLASGLEDYPLFPYLEGAALERELPRADARKVAQFLTRHAGMPTTEALRRRWLAQLAARKQWPDFLAAWSEQEGLPLRCAHGMVEALLLK